ncbi:glycosylhydrolase-like jelly roll fold domain-containing protein, partial [Nocardioides sp. NPDC051685]|uniref:glycosylhydrolase-like jelly roll fold domain-containing protein n=1 Tax=Nocardioides sp. NPDC051685 TaxID=3364334 RepID=UPI0037926148
PSSTSQQPSSTCDDSTRPAWPPAEPGRASPGRHRQGQLKSRQPPGVAFTAAADQLGRTGEQYAGTYWRAVNDAFATNYYQRQAAWMGEHGLQLITNPLLDEEGPQQRMHSTGDLAKNNQYAQVPGTDMITTDYTAGRQTTLMRNAASAAHQSGAERALVEVFGNSGWGVAPEYMHATVGALATRGANFTALHAMWTDEKQVYFAPPFGPASTYWDAMGDVDAWIGRVMELGRGSSLAQTALVQPQRAAEQTRATDAEHQLDDSLSGAAFALERGQVDFDLLSDGSLSGDPGTRYQARPDDGVLKVGEASYRMLVLPTTPVLDLETAKTLKRFVRDGGRVAAVGPLPELEARGRTAALARELDSLFGDASTGWTRNGDGFVAVVADDLGDLGGLAAGAGVTAADLSPAAPAVRVLRTGRDGDVAFLVNNESDQAISTSATLPVDGVPEIWDPRDGSTEVAATYDEGGRKETTVPLRLDPYETLAIVFRKGTRAGAHLVGDQVAESVTRGEESLEATVLVDEPGTTTLTGTDGRRTYRGEATVSDPLTPIALDGPWTVKLEREGETEQTRPLGSWTTIDPRFSGSATYRTSVDVTAADLAGRRMLLDLGQVRDIAQVTINGVVLPRALWQPYVIDATEALRAGTNTIEVRVTNTLLNQRGKANQVPPTSGLLGPVSLRPRAVVVTELTASR